jgi:hypothetical protein
VEAFSEPAIGRGEQIASFGLFPLIAPEAGEIGGGKEFWSFGALPLRNRERWTITLLGRHSIACGVQQIASRPVQTGFVSPLFNGFNDLLSFGEAIQALRRLPQLSVRSGEVPRRSGGGALCCHSGNGVCVSNRVLSRQQPQAAYFRRNAWPHSGDLLVLMVPKGPA